MRLKPSGVEWLGDVPEHWELRRLKQLFREVDNRSEDGAETLLSLRMYEGLKPHHEVSERPVSCSEVIGFKRVAPGDIVMNRMRASLGMFGIAFDPGIVSPDYAILRPLTPATCGEFFLGLFKTPLMRSVFRSESKGLGTGSSGFLRLYFERFGTIPVPLPPSPEQAEIAKFIMRETAALSSAHSRTLREIDLIREYRVRLTADVVTGKLDVRDVELPAVDEGDEPLAEEGLEEDDETTSDEDEGDAED